MSKRSKSKYPALDRKLNTKARQIYIDPYYIDGVFDKEGNQVIRALTEEEKAWLNKFYEETIVTSFNNDDSDFYPSREEKKELYTDNNRRNRCLLNYATRTGSIVNGWMDDLDKLTIEGLEHLAELDPYLIVEILHDEVRFRKLLKDSGLSDADIVEISKQFNKK